ncbi:MAG: alkaline phosphatase family protein [Hyphomicrobiaceae bacterium]|nr:alkaline phosphatase family protein [Hyphomicrobiaceae bacterium]
MPDTRVLIVVFDALRPEFLTQDLMPNLYAFANRGVWYRNSHSTFFTETRVNQSVVVTGCMPQRHGIVANKFYVPALSADGVLNTGDDVALEEAFHRADGRLLDMPTLGERLARHGLKFASLSAGTPGGGRLINHSAKTNGTWRFAMRRPEAAEPTNAHARIVERIGALPQYSLPAKAWITWAVNAYLEVVEPEAKPHAMLLWLCEPDETFHYHGIGSPQSLEAIRHVDGEFGRILAHHADAIAAGRLQVIAMSDHGQISLVGEALDLAAQLERAGFRASRKPGPDVDLVVVPGSAAGIWNIGGDADLTERCANWLREQTWAGPMFTRSGMPGTLRHADVCLEHPRAPDIAMVFRSDDNHNAHRRQGETVHDAPYPVGGGCHGGLSRYELHNVLTLGGTKLKDRTVLDVPAGNVDITPTVLTLLGLPVPAEFDGRPLREAMHGGPDPASIDWRDDILGSSNTSGPRTYLSVSDLGHTRYLNRGWVA